MYTSEGVSCCVCGVVSTVRVVSCVRTYCGAGSTRVENLPLVQLLAVLEEVFFELDVLFEV